MRILTGACACIAALVAAAAAGAQAGETAAAAASPSAAAVAHGRETGAPADATPVASVGDGVLTQADIAPRLQPQLERLRARYEAQRRTLDLQLEKGNAMLLQQAVDQAVTERVLELEAKKRRRTREQLYAALEPAPVTDAQVRAFYDGGAQRFDQPFEELAPQIRRSLEQRAADAARSAYVGRLRAEYGVRMAYEVRRYDVGAHGPSRGPADAALTIVEFADFQCPYCAQVAPLITRLMQEHPGRLRHVYRHLPLTSIHPHAQGAALAAACAAEGGRFWEAHDAMLADQSKLDRESLLALAGRLGLDAAAFQACLDGEPARQVVAADVAASRELPVEGTPTLFLNGRLYLGSLDYDSIAKLVDEELARAAAGGADVDARSARVAH